MKRKHTSAPPLLSPLDDAAAGKRKTKLIKKKKKENDSRSLRGYIRRLYASVIFVAFKSTMWTSVFLSLSLGLWCREQRHK